MATSSSRWWRHPAHGQGRGPSWHSALVLGLGIASASLSSDVVLLLVDVVRVSSSSSSAVVVAAAERLAARAAPAVADEALAGVVRVVEVAAAGMFASPAPLEGVAGPLERGELGAPDGDLDVEGSDSW